MHRTTILLPEELRQRAESEARSLGISFSELVRRRLQKGSEGMIGEKNRPAFFSRRPWDGAAPADLAENHDRYLYDE